MTHPNLKELRESLRCERVSLLPPARWLKEAAKTLGGQGQMLQVALFLAFHWMERQHPQCYLHPRDLSKLNIHRTTAYRALEQLKEHGLVKVSRNRKEPPLVTILSPSTESLS